MKQLLHYFIVLLVGINATHAQEISERIKLKIDSTYNALIKSEDVVGLSLAIVDHGKLVYSVGYGFADVKKNIKASANTVYRIGSITKSFTSLSLMQLQESRKLTIMDPVTNYLTDLHISSRFNKPNSLILRDMMSHVSGLPSDLTNGFFCDAPPDINWLILELNKQYTIAPERYMHAYSNVAYGLLGETIHRVSGETYANYIDKHIFEPLNMSHSFIVFDSTKHSAFAKGYYGKTETVDPMIRDQAAGLIHSNVLDMSNYMMMYLNQGNFKGSSIVSGNSIAEMEKNQISDISIPVSEEWGYGLYGKRVKVKHGADSSTLLVKGHGGDTYLYHADFKYISELEVGVVLMTNSSNGAGLVNGNKLLKLYLALKDSTLISDLPADSNLAKTDSVVKGNDIKGVYNMGEMVIKVSNLDKIAFKQGSVKVKFIRNLGDNWTYRAKAVLFYVVPIKINNQEFKFVKHEDNVYLKVRFPKSGQEEFMAIKSNPTSLQSDWVNRCGEYELAGSFYKCQNCPFLNFEGTKLKLLLEEGSLKMTFQGKTPDTYGEMYLETFDSKVAFGGGIGRGKGETVSILPNGNLYYSGFEFKKKSKTQ